MASRFSKVNIPRVSGNRLQGSIVTQLAGLDMVTPVDQIKEGRTPESHDFRLYDETVANREVAVSSRKGPGFYTLPLTENLSASNTSTAGASTATVGVEINTHIQPFLSTTNERLNRIDVSLAQGTASSFVRIDVYEDQEGRPGRMLTSSSFMETPTTPDFATARFINAPMLVAGQQYWFALYIQDDGTGLATLSTTTNGLKARTGIGILGATETTYSLVYRIYTSPATVAKGSYRFNRENSVNRTLAAFGTSMYVVDETTNTFRLLLSGLSSEAQYYDFTNGDGKVFWVNGYDELTTWNGIFEDEADNILLNPSFTTDISGYTAWSASTLARSTAQFDSSPASMYVSKASSTRGFDFTIALKANKRYKVTMRVRAETATNIKAEGITAVAGAWVKDIIPSTSLTAGVWTTISAYVTPDVDMNAIRTWSSAGNFWVDDINVIETGIEYIKHTNLPKLSLIEFSKDRLFGVPTGDRNRLIFSENPGNPSKAALQWYKAWLSVSFIYVPRPFNGSPITAIIPFQDQLIIFTQDKKYMLSGSNRGSYFLREATGSEGALSPRGVISDANFIYFVAESGIMRWNGAKDDELSVLIKPLYDKCPDKWGITLALWDGNVRAYMNSQFSSVKDITAIFSNRYNEWMLDTDTFITSAIYYDDADDQMELIEFSSLIPMAFNAEDDYNSLGAPIDFDYRLRYDSRGMPGQRKKYKRYVPLVQSVGRSFPITYGVDKNFEDMPREKEQQLNVGGAKIGSFLINGETRLSGATGFKPRKTAISGYSNYMQFRVRRRAVNNQVAFMGVQFTYKAKKL